MQASALRRAVMRHLDANSARRKMVHDASRAAERNLGPTQALVELGFAALYSTSPQLFAV